MSRNDEVRNGEDTKIKFIEDKPNVKVEGRDEAFTGLTKEELMEYANDPFWVRLRWLLFALFWIVWIAMLVVAIILIIKAPRCSVKAGDNWAKESSLYQVYPRSFKDSDGNGVGDFNGLASKIDYISKLNSKNIIVNAPLETNPFFQDEALVNFTKVNPEYGSNQDFQNLINKVHEKGMKIIMELDLHHTSNSHPWFNKSLNQNTKQKDFYVWANGDVGNPPNLERSLWAGSAWTFSPIRNQYYFSHFANNLPNLNLNNEQVKTEIKDIIEFWMKYNIDGILIPNADLLFKQPPFNAENATQQKKTHDLIAFIKDVIAKSAKNKKILIVQPYGDDNSMLLGSKADLVVNKQFTKISDNCDGKCISAHLTGADKKENQAWMLGDKDTTRVATRMGNNPTFTNALNALLILLPGASMPYYGDEIGIADNPQSVVPQTYDPLCKIPFKGECRDLHRSPMQWRAQSNAGFSSDPNKIWTPVNQNFDANNVETLEQANKNLPVFARLNDLKSHEPFKSGAFTLLPMQNPSILAFLRKSGTVSYLTLINFGKEQASFVGTNLPGNKGDIVLDSANPLTYVPQKPGAVQSVEVNKPLTLVPGQVLVLDLKK